MTRRQARQIEIAWQSCLPESRQRLAEQYPAAKAEVEQALGRKLRVA